MFSNDKMFCYVVGNAGYDRSGWVPWPSDGDHKVFPMKCIGGRCEGVYIALEFFFKVALYSFELCCVTKDGVAFVWVMLCVDNDEDAGPVS